jgi:hypothetical protein
MAARIPARRQDVRATQERRIAVILRSSADTAVRAAAERIRSGVRRTATVRSRAFSEALGAEVFLKMENRQTGRTKSAAPSTRC